MGNRKKSGMEKLMGRAAVQAERYEMRINQQKQIIDRLVAANAAQGDALYIIEHESKDVRHARKTAKQAVAKVKEILATPNEEEQQTA